MYQCVREDVAESVETSSVLAAEQIDAHDAEDEPEDEADDQHVDDWRDRLDQRVHYHLPLP